MEEESRFPHLKSEAKTPSLLVCLFSVQSIPLLTLHPLCLIIIEYVPLLPKGFVHKCLEQDGWSVQYESGHRNVINDHNGEYIEQRHLMCL